MADIVPIDWMPQCNMRRIICHWTAGTHQASDNDREHYHILIAGDGELVRGDHTIDDNVSTADDDYAAHTRRFNTGSIGVSVCCMANARESPFDAGQFPMLQAQWEKMAEVVATLCRRYGIALDRKTVLGHGEVESIHGIAQRGKWDPLKLPWQPALSMPEVGDLFRARVAQF